jgi:hypothetical protein
MTSISALFKPDAIKATWLYKSLAKGTPPSVRNTLKMNNTLTNQLLLVTNGTIGVITFPILTTNMTNKPCIIGTETTPTIWLPPPFPATFSISPSLLSFHLPLPPSTISQFSPRTL